VGIIANGLAARNIARMQLFSAEWSPEMAIYRCCYLENARTQSEVLIETTDDATALLKAEELLAKSRFVAMEIWQESRPVGRVTLGSPAALISGEGSGHTPSPDDLAGGPVLR
jgi:hypothetical protein